MQTINKDGSKPSSPLVSGQTHLTPESERQHFWPRMQSESTKQSAPSDNGDARNL